MLTKQKMVAGNTCIAADKAVCEETYGLLRKNQSIGGGLSSALTSPKAKKYVERLLREAPLSLPAVRNEAEDGDGYIQVRRRLAVISGVHVGSPGYYVAEELALSANMDIILIGKSPRKLQETFLAINQEAKKRTRSISSSIGSSTMKTTTNAMPKLYQVQMNVNSLRSVATAAEEIKQICTNHYHGQLHVLVNLAGEVHTVYSTTEEGVEVNVGQNYLAPRLLVDLLLPVLRAAATPDYKPRVVQEASLGHCRGSDFDPCRLRKCPKEGGAPNGTIVRNEVTQDLEYSKKSGAAGLDMYYRSKMALMADTLALANEEPMLAVVSCDPGVLTYAATPTSCQTDAVTSDATAAPLSPRRSLLSRTDSRGLGLGDLFLFHLGPSQGARSALRAALDPDFNTTKTMHYLHCDGNPWAMSEPTARPQFPQRTGEKNDYYELDAYAEIVRDVGDEISGQLVVDRDCKLELCLQMQSAELSSTSLFLGGSSQHSHQYSHRASSSSSSFLDLSYSSLLGRSYSSLIPQ